MRSIIFVNNTGSIWTLDLLDGREVPLLSILDVTDEVSDNELMAAIQAPAPLGLGSQFVDTLLFLRVNGIDYDASESSNYGNQTVAPVPGPHSLGGGGHIPDLLINLNSKITDATLDDVSGTRDPKAHAPSHEGGADPITPLGIGADTPLLRDGAITAHTGIPSAHHIRYDNTEAVSAMGAKADANALNHDRYTDLEALAQGTAAVVTHVALPNPHTQYQLSSQKGIANGYASLDGGGTVPLSELPSSVLGALSYQGAWDALTNTPPLVSGVGVKGYYYVVNIAGSTNLDGITDWKIGDWAVFNGAAWEKVDNTESVVTVFGRTGVITATAGDYAASQVTNDSLVAGAGVSGALNTLDSGKEPVFAKNSAFNKSFGNVATTVCEGNDVRLSDARTPTSHAIAGALHSTSTKAQLEAKISDVASLLTNNAGEINLYTAKTTPADADIVLIEDSADTYNKKKMTRANFTSLFGQDYQKVESLSLSTTTATTFQTKATLTTPALTGQYLITWHAVVQQSSMADAVQSQLYNTTDAAIVGVIQEKEPKDVADRLAVGGFAEITFAGAAKSFEIQYRQQRGSTAGIEDARIMIYRVG